MSKVSKDQQQRMAETVRLVVAYRERAPRSPRMERALKRLIWRYSQTIREAETQEEVDVPK